MSNRYTRDQLIKIAIDMAHLPNLEVNDMPDGVVLPNALSIQWLQDIIDFWYHMVPFSTTVVRTQLNFSANVESYPLPDNFILDVRNGYMVNTITDDPLSLVRTHRVVLQKYLNRKVRYQKATNVLKPDYYCVAGVSSTPGTVGRQQLNVMPIPTVSGYGELWYYALPAALEADDKPLFPNDYVCTEYIRVRALEWAHLYDPGTAQKFCDKLIAGMKAAGLMHEPEDDEIPFDDLRFRRGGYGNVEATYGWLGPV